MDNNSNAANPFAPPQAHVSDLNDPNAPYLIAGRGVRLVAALIDTAFILAVFGVLALVSSFNLFKPDVEHLFMQNATNTAWGFLVFVLLQSYTLNKSGQTLGKLLMGIKIVRTDGSAAGAARLILVRYGTGVLAQLAYPVGSIYGIVDALLIFRSSNKCLHDNIADTIVVKA